MTPTAPTVGLALIVRDEASSLPGLLQSIEGAFDRVVLLDTGSKDDTVAVFREWAEGEAVGKGAAFSFQVGEFAWVDDFSAARTAADNLLVWGLQDISGTTFPRDPQVDWTCWADADDVLQGAQNLRALAAQSPPELAAWVADYRYAVDDFGNTVCTLRRERLVRAGAGTWYGRVHEAQLLNGPTSLIDPSVALWVHRKSHDAAPSQPRNLRILRKWLKQELENPRVLGYLGTEEAAMGRHKIAVGYYRRYLRLKTGWDEERAQIHRKLACSLLALGEPHKARTVAYEALSLLPSWPDSYLTLAECAYRLQEHANAIQWANRVLELGQPDSLLILNPTDYTLHPRLVLAGACGALGDLQGAIDHAEAALAIVPSLPDLEGHLYGWRSDVKREYTARAFVSAAEQLCAHDEQLGALTLLEQCVPHFAKDHPHVVAYRSQVRENVYPLLNADGIAKHYEAVTEGGTLDVELVGHLPRARMLAAGVLEQITEGEAA